jgi:nucleoside-diphosphate-sugar epimerase
VGRETVEKLIGTGKAVVALVRSEEAKKDLEGLGATAILGDALTYKDVEDSMWGCDAAVTTLGGVTDGKRVDYDGNRNVVEAAGILGITRLVYVTSIGCGSSKDALSEGTYEVLKDALMAKEKVEKQLEKFYKFSCDYTVIRPGGLITAPETGNAALSEDTSISGVIHRADVASLLVSVLDDESSIKKIYSAVDPTAVVPARE